MVDEQRLVGCERLASLLFDPKKRTSYYEIYIVKSEEESIDILGKLRWIDQYAEVVLCEQNTKEEYLNMGHLDLRKTLWRIFDMARDYDIMWQGRELTEEKFIETDLLQICKWIMSL